MRKDNMRKSIIKYGSIGLLFILLLTAIFNFIMTREAVTSIAYDNYWIGYYGSIMSGLLSGGITFIGVWITIEYYKNQDKKEEISKRQPYLRISNKTEEENKIATKIVFDNDKSLYPPYTINCIIENIGLGPAIDIEIKEFSNNKKQFQESVINLMPKENCDIELHYVSTKESDDHIILVLFKDILNNTYEQKFEIEGLDDIKVSKISKPSIIDQNL